MKCIVNAHGVISESLEGPLAAYITSFSESVSDQGYTLDSVKKQTRIIAFFSLWLKQNRIRLHDVSTEHATHFLRYRARKRCPYAGDPAALRRFIDFLRRQHVLPAQDTAPPVLTPIEHCVQTFEQYLREERALARTTIINYVPFIGDFLRDRFGNRQVELSCLFAGDVVRFVQRQAPRLHLKRAKLMTTALRSFLRYVRYRGDVTLDLAAAVPIVANWSMTSIPRAIASDQVRRLLTSIDRSTAVGRRDYAILILLARLGLRSGEVAFLELDDLDWNTGQLRVHGKGGLRSDLPLPAEVGEAIVAYLRHGRPPSASRRVFLRAKAPVRGFRGASGVGSIVRHSIKRAGVNAPTFGAHQFRHGLATEMLRQGASLADIGEVLGHRHPQTTKIYTKVDVKALRTLALPWPGDAR